VATVGGLDLHPPPAGLIVLLRGEGAEPVAAAAADVQLGPSLIEPASPHSAEPPVNEDGVAEPAGSEDAREAVDDVARPRREILVAVLPPLPPGPLVLEHVGPGRGGAARAGSARARTGVGRAGVSRAPEDVGRAHTATGRAGVRRAGMGGHLPPGRD